MFAKRQSALAAAAGSPPAPKGPLIPAGALKALVKKPPVIVGAAGLFLLAAVALFVVVLGDPRAGAPSARVALKRAPAEAAPVPTGFEAFSMGAMDLYQDLTGTGDPALTGASGGEALI
ncbi:MAG: divergent polysaccharide deacetylase family protein, partial [Caulobacterales bacterium]|nr:divergent polysaccharide deacetylase family protein [Caulobacterales bacterium]